MDVGLDQREGFLLVALFEIRALRHKDPGMLLQGLRVVDGDGWRLLGNVQRALHRNAQSDLVAQDL